MELGSRPGGPASPLIVRHDIHLGRRLNLKDLNGWRASPESTSTSS